MHSPVAATTNVLTDVEDPLFAGDQRARTCLRGDVPHQSGCKGKLQFRVLGLARQGWETLHDHGKAGVSGLRQNHLLCTHVNSGQMATASLSPGPDPGPGEHSTQIAARHKKDACKYSIL